MTAREGYTAKQRFDAALAALVAAAERLSDAADRMPDPQAAFDLVTKAADEYRDESWKLTSALAAIRARQVQRIYEAEKLTLVELGQRIGGLTKQRAKKMLQAAAASRQEDDPPSPEEDQDV
jgi:hypothetical protein